MTDEPHDLDDRARRSADAVRALAARMTAGVESLADESHRAPARVLRGPRRVRMLLAAAVIVGVCAVGVAVLSRGPDRATVHNAQSSVVSSAVDDSEPTRVTGSTAPSSSADESTDESTTTGSVAGPAATTTTLAGSTTSAPTAADGCDATKPPAATPLEQMPTFMTVSPGPTTLEYTLTASPQKVCPGGVVTITITVHNSGAEAVHVTPRLVMTQMLPHIDLASTASGVVEPGATATLVASIVIPNLHARSYVISVYGYDASTGIVVVDPPVPTASTAAAR